jgi:WD40 repeat protein
MTIKTKYTIDEVAMVYIIIQISKDNLAIGLIGKIKILNIRSHECIKTLIGHQYAVSALITLSNGHLASGSHDYTIRIWDSNYICINILTGHTVCPLSNISRIDIYYLVRQTVQ